MPESLISFEDAKREFLQVRQLELGKLALSNTALTTVNSTVTAQVRTGVLSTTLGLTTEDLIPSHVEFLPDGGDEDDKYKVEIVPIQELPSYEGGRAISFYGDPLNYSVSWDFWDEGDLKIWYDKITDLIGVDAVTQMQFPSTFLTFLVKKTALSLVRIARLKLSMIDPAEYRQTKQEIYGALSAFEASLYPQVEEWRMEFRKYINLDRNIQPHLRRTNDELISQGYNNVTGSHPLDFTG